MDSLFSHCGLKRIAQSALQETTPSTDNSLLVASPVRRGPLHFLLAQGASG